MTKTSVQAVEDGELRETALSAPTHSRGRPQVRIFAETFPGENCEDARIFMQSTVAGTAGYFEPNTAQLHSHGRLRVNFEEGSRQHDPCTPDFPRGHRLYENHTIKVKMRSGGAFNWAYDNGADLYRVELRRRMENGVQHAYLRFLTPVHNPSDLPRRDQIAEICPFAAILPNLEKTAELEGFRMRLVGNFDVSNQEIEVQMPLVSNLIDWWENTLPDIPHREGDQAPYLYLRLWQKPSDSSRLDDLAGADVPLADTGIRLQFLRNGMNGDEWTFSCRLTEPELTVPWQYTETAGAAPVGPERYYALLGQIRWHLDDGRPVAEVSDCRQRFRPPWRDMRCCTYTVGDGRTSHGDYNRLEDAIAALPSKGGHICLLPGNHVGGVMLIAQDNVTISGCGHFSTLHNRGTSPVITIDSGEGIVFRDFAIEDNFSLAIGALHVTGLTFKNISTSGFGEALSVIECIDVVISECDFNALSYPGNFDLDQLENVRPLAFIGGRNIQIINNRFVANSQDNYARQGLGGLQIASRSTHVNIKHNYVQGGAGNGITIGDLRETKGKRKDAEITDYITATETASHVAGKSRWDGGMVEAQFVVERDAQNRMRAVMETTAADSNEEPIRVRYNRGRKFRLNRPGCITIDPRPEKPEIPEGPGDFTIEWTAYGIEHLHIEDNEIADMGASGISIPVWFDPNAEVQGHFTLRHSRISNNHIFGVVNLPLPETIEAEALTDMAFGGIALDAAHDLIIDNNKIEQIGRAAPLPVCGIYLGSGASVRIADNMIHDIGQKRPAIRGASEGIVGGIVVDDMSTQNTSKAGASSASLNVCDNDVSVNLGPGIDVRGRAKLSVCGNRVTSYSPVFALARPRLGHTLSVVNLNDPTVEFNYIFAIALAFFFVGNPDITKKQRNQKLPFGAIPIQEGLLCHDNEIVAVHDAQHQIYIPFSSTSFVASIHDVSFQSNTVKNTASVGSYLCEIGAFSQTSLRCIGNLAMNSQDSFSPLGIASISLFNTTANNQSSHPNWLFGLQKQSGFTTNMVFAG